MARALLPAILLLIAAWGREDRLQAHVPDNFGYKLSPQIETLGGLLAKHGYATGAAVSSAILARETGVDRGFAFYDDQGAGGRTGRHAVRRSLQCSYCGGKKGQLEAARKALERFVGSAPRSRFAKDLAEAHRLLKSLGRG
jgi:hypothetical protein